jgi:hypothetical protein
MSDADHQALAEANLTHDRPPVRRGWIDPAPSRQTVYATMPATPRGIARVRGTL